MKKILVYLTMIVGILFACTIDSLFDHPVPVLLGAVLVVLLILDFTFITREDMDRMFYDKDLKE